MKALAVVLPLSLDTFAVAATLAAAGRGRAAIVVFPLAETVMTLLGLAVGVALPFGQLAGGAVLIAVGLWMLVETVFSEDEESQSLNRPLVALAVGISLDELAIGVSLGLLGIPVVLGVGLVAAQAVVAAAAGYALGSHIRGAWIEQLAAAALIGLGIVFLFV